MVCFHPDMGYTACDAPKLHQWQQQYKQSCMGLAVTIAAYCVKLLGCSAVPQCTHPLTVCAVGTYCVLECIIDALQVISVDAAAGVLVLGGADIVDGSPVLDIKPYVPFCDSLPHATAPDWVRVGSAVLLTQHASQQPHKLYVVPEACT